VFPLKMARLERKADLKQLHVLFITYYWPPSGGAGVQRCLKFVKYLSSFNIHPTLVTVNAEEASYAVLDPTLQEEVPESVPVYRTSTTEPFGLYKKISGKKEIPFGGFANEKKTGLGQKFFRFIRGNLFVPDARVGWNRHVLQLCGDLLKAQHFDAVITSSPPHSTQLVGLELKKTYGLRWIADLRDPWTDIYYYDQLQHLGLTRKLDAAYEKKVLLQADEVLVVSPDMKRIFLNKSSRINPDKIHIIPNGFDEEDFQIPSQPPENEFLITYTGTITEAYNLEMFFKALATTAERHPTIPYRLRFVGTVSEEIQGQIAGAGLAAITEFVGYVPHQESVRHLLHSTLLLMAIPDVPNNFGILTGKLFEYLASNKPIVCIGPIHSDADQIIDECGAGRVFHYAAYDLMVDHLDLMSDAWKVNPNLDLPLINYQQYSRRQLTAKLAAFIRG
jgi:glycosyltransferase involved in cell wall biosynthesis